MAGEARIGTIVIGMRVATGALSKGMKTATSAVSAGVSQIKELGKALVPLGVAVAGVGVAFEALRRGSSEAIDDIAHLSDRVGASTENLTGLKFAAKLSNVEFDQLSVALTKLGVNLAKAQADGEGTEGVFARLGLSAGALAKMDRVDAFKQIADAISRIKNPAEQAALSVELFGKAGAQLGPLFQQGSAGITAAMKKADELGLSFNRIDAAKVEQANDAWDTINATLAGVGNTLAIAVAPAFTAIFDTIAQVIGQGNTWFKSQESGSNFVIESLGHVGKAFGVVGDVIHTVKLGFLAAQSAITTGLGFVAEGIAGVAKWLQDLVNRIPGVKVAFGDFAQTYAEDLKRLGGEQWTKFQEELAKAPPSEQINKFFDGLKVKAFEAQDAAVFAKKDFEHLADVGADMDKQAEKNRKLFSGALEKGSAEARSVVLAFKQGKEDEAAKATARNTARQAELQQKTLEAVSGLATTMAAAFAGAPVL